ncbi:TetR/AcrR family transcriptional regulator [Pedobacter sp. L105]|uniref:TetR/AcrR family transcriptional regulator n=1 Tax=Pedobacter sp. L105 TaxID=1641871 RepID=UPI00131CFF9D|nr:TetR/AcrR family transcriptional regulator [Pedobacter sp. L105]
MSETDSIKDDIVQEQIIQSAQTLFLVHGFNKVNMDDLAKAIGKGRSSLYYYYKNKEEIFIAVMDIAIRKMITEIRESVELASTIEKKIGAFYLTRLRLAKRRKELYNAADSGMDSDEMSRYTKVKRIIHKRIFNLESSLLTRVLNEAIEKGELKVIPVEELETLVYVLLSSLHGLKREMIIEDDFSGIEITVKVLINALMNGLKK